MGTFRNLLVYKKAYDAALKAHRLSLRFPRIEQYALGDQIRRSSKSIVANMAEGLGKNRSDVEEIRFLQIAVGSSDETQVWLEFAKDLGYLSPEEFEVLHGAYNEISRMLSGLIGKRNRKSEEPPDA